MLYLQFIIDNERYVMATSAITEVAPLIPLRKLPDVPDYVSGLMNYRGKSVPVIDASQLLAGYDTALRLSSRIVIVKVCPSNGEPLQVGLLLEKATETLKIPDEDFVESGIDNPQASYLGKVVLDGKGVLQQISPDNILSKMNIELLFSKTEDA